MRLRQFLTCVSCSCMYMTYVSRYRSAKGATAQSRPHTSSALWVALPGCSATYEGMFALASSGVPVYRAGWAADRSSPGHSSQDCFYRQASISAGRRNSPSCCPHAADVERHRRSRFDRSAQSRSEAWLKGAQPGHRARFSGNISSTVYSIPNSSRPMKPWSPTSDGLHTTARR
jgi:hypothetical protein